MRGVIILFVFFASVNIFSQSFSGEDKRVIDSLNSLINDPAQHDTIISNSYLELAAMLHMVSTDTLIELSQKAVDIAKEAWNKNPNEIEKEELMELMAAGYNNIGFGHGKKGDSFTQLEYYKKSLAIKRKMKYNENLSTSLNNIGYVYMNQGDIPSALEYFHEALRLREEQNDLQGVAGSLSNLATLLYRQGEVDKAIENELRSIEICQKIGFEKGKATSMNNLGLIFRKQHQLNKALNYYNQSLAIHRKRGDYRNIARSLNNIGAVYQELALQKGLNERVRDSLLQQSQANVLEGFKIRKEQGDKKGLASSYVSLARVSIKRKEMAQAENYGAQALEVAKLIGYPRFQMEAASILSEVYENTGKGKLALEMYRLYIQMRDSLHNSETQKATARQQAKYEYEKQKAIDDAEHEKQLAIEQEAKEKQQILTYATAGGLGLVGIFLIFVFNRLKVTRKQKGIIEEAHAELGEKNKEILDSINYAKRIQSAILPPTKVVKEYLQESFILYKPKDIVAGDFYWLEHVEDKILFAAADCTGHGVPGAMVSVVCNNGLNRSVREHNLTTPGEILTKTRDIVVAEFEKSEEEVKDGMDIALCSLQGNTLEYAGAHNPLWIIRKGSEEIEEIKADKQPIGKTDKPLPYTTHKVELQKGDTIYIFSDGYADQFGGEKGKKMKTANFKKMLLSISNESMKNQRELIDEAFESWKGDLEQLDDVCVIGVRI